jgi:predicted DNA-binding transcriptional regulator AlpA
MRGNPGSRLGLKRRFISEIELEQLTGISRRTWQKHRPQTRRPRYYKIHGAIRYDIEEVLAWIRALAVGGAVDPLAPAAEVG